MSRRTRRSDDPATPGKAGAGIRPRWHRASHQPGAASTDPPKWWEVIGDGTRAEAEEGMVFVSLAGAIDLPWLPAGEVAAQAGLPVARTRAILEKHVDSGLVARHPSRADLYADGRRIARRAAPPPQSQ